MTVHSSNNFLSYSQMTDNAEYILAYLLKRGWTKNAVCGMLGNMQTESTINPGLWQSRDAGNLNGGLGLVQWTPATKIIDYANSKGLSPTAMDTQLQRILYEVANGIQYYSPSRSFKEFTKSTDSAYDLGLDFLAHYERPADPNQPIRGTQAEKWFSTLKGNGSVDGGMQLAQFPMDYLYVSQGENSEFSHLDNPWAMDFVGTYDEYPYYAPCDCTLVSRDDANAIMIWKSDGEVMCADGQPRQIVWRCIHDNNLLYTNGKVLAKGELMGHTGSTGNVTGDHLHLEVFEGTTYSRETADSTWRHIFDVFAVNGVTIANGDGYDWKTSDWVDGEGGVTVPKKDKGIALMHMYLSNTIVWG